MTPFEAESCTRPGGQHGPFGLLLQTIGDVEIAMEYCSHCQEPLAGGAAVASRSLQAA